MHYRRNSLSSAAKAAFRSAIALQAQQYLFATYTGYHISNNPPCQQSHYVFYPDGRMVCRDYDLATGAVNFGYIDTEIHQKP